VFELGQFDLQLAFMRFGALREDVEDQAGPIDHATLQRLLQVALLTGAQFVIEDYQVGLVRAVLGSHFLDLALAGVGRRIRAVATTMHHRTDRCARRKCQQTDLVKLLGRSSRPKSSWTMTARSSPEGRSCMQLFQEELAPT
jgi:hypothetical protein